MASSQKAKLEAAKFLHKLVQDYKDEPAKLATKLHVILQHMKSSGKEHSMPYQVISRGLETVVNQHGLSLRGSSSQAVGVAKDSGRSLSENESSKLDPFPSGRPRVGPSGGAHDYYQGSVVQRNGQSSDQGGPSSLVSRSANYHSQDRRDAANWNKKPNQKDGEKATTKRKWGDTSSPVEPHVYNPSQIDPRNTRKAKLITAVRVDHLPVKSGADAKVRGGMAAPTGASSMFQPVFSSSMQSGSASALGSSTSLSDMHKMAQIGWQNSGMLTMMLRQGVLPMNWKYSMIFGEQQLKQLRAQCLVYLAFRNRLTPMKHHVEIALGTTFSSEGEKAPVLSSASLEAYLKKNKEGSTSEIEKDSGAEVTRSHALKKPVIIKKRKIESQRGKIFIGGDEKKGGIEVSIDEIIASHNNQQKLHGYTGDDDLTSLWCEHCPFMALADEEAQSLVDVELMNGAGDVGINQYLQVIGARLMCIGREQALLKEKVNIAEVEMLKKKQADMEKELSHAVEKRKEKENEIETLKKEIVNLQNEIKEKDKERAKVLGDMEKLENAFDELWESIRN